MGARSKTRRHTRAQRRQQGENRSPDDNRNHNNHETLSVREVDCGDTAESRAAAASPAPQYIQRLLQSTQFAELEEVCADISVFALQSGQHEQLIRADVPQRLVQLIFSPSSLSSTAAATAANEQDDEEAAHTTTTTTTTACEEDKSDGMHDGSDSHQDTYKNGIKIHRGMLYMQIAAVEALRNVISASGNDVVLDVLTAADLSGAVASASCGFGVGLCQVIEQTWQRVLACTRAREVAPCRDSEAGGEANVRLARVNHKSECTAMSNVMNDCTHNIDSSNNMHNINTNEHRANEEDEEEKTQRTAGSSPRLGMSLLRYLASLLQLLAVCIEGSEVVAEVCSGTSRVQTFLNIMQQAYTVITSAPPPAAQDSNTCNNAPEEDEDECCVQQKKLQHSEECELVHHDIYDVAERWAEVGVAASDVVDTLSSDNVTLMYLIDDRSSAAEPIPGNTSIARTDAASPRAILANLARANAVLSWLSALPSYNARTTSCLDTLQAHTHETQERLDELRYSALRLQQLQLTLHAQLTHMHLSPSAEYARRVLPVVTHTLRVWTPMAQWRQALPLLCEDCTLEESCRAAAVRMLTHRVRCVHLATRVLHKLVEFVGEQNAGGEEDEVAFRANPLSALLYEQHTLQMFAPVLRDVLWMRPGTHSTAPPLPRTGHDMNDNCRYMPNTTSVTVSQHNSALPSQATEQQQYQQDSEDVMSRAQQALRCGGVGAINSEVTTLQFLLLSTEVVVWGIASALLLMVPVEQLGDASAIWSAVMAALRTRYNLLCAQKQQESEKSADHVVCGVYNIAADSPAARSLLWLQLESLAQMLWTMQRKQAKSAGGVMQMVNTLGAGPADMDVLTRLSWESAGAPTAITAKSPSATKLSTSAAAAYMSHTSAIDVAALRQACVGAVGLLCCSLRSVDAVAAGARFTLAVLRANMPAHSFAAKLDAKASRAVHGSNTDGAHHSNDTFFACGDDILNRGCSSYPTDSAAREAWLARLRGVDGAIATRCEAANALMDFFLDETYDATVYTPLGVQNVLESCLPQLRATLRRRQQLTKDMHKNYRLDVEPAAMDQWTEVAENLGEFLNYKRQHNSSA